MSPQFLLPDLGEGLTEAEIVTWLVAPGDIVVVDQPVVEVESAKSIVELPSPYGGRVERLDAAAGQVVFTGSSLLTIASLSEEHQTPIVGAPDVLVADRSAADVSAADLVAAGAVASGHAASGSGAVLVGYGTKESTTRLARPAGGRFGARSSSTPVPVIAAPGAPLRLDPSMLLDPTRRSQVVSPLVRARARANGFDASQLSGSGTDSIVRSNDVEAAIASRASSGSGAGAGLSTGAGSVGIASSVGAGSSTGADSVGIASSSATGTHIPLVGMRKLIASRLSESRRVVPEVTLWLDVDVTELLRAKQRLRDVSGERFSLTSLVARFVVAGLRKYPVLNASVVDLADGSQEILQHSAINLGIAAQTPRGLMVPVVHGTQDLTTRQLRDEITTLVAAAERADFTPAALSGGTFTLNNYGSFGVDGSTPIINYPEVAMLGIGRIKERPWVVNHELSVRDVMVLSFVFDHRVCDGDVASGFLTFVAGCIEEPLLALGEL